MSKLAEEGETARLYLSDAEWFPVLEAEDLTQGIRGPFPDWAGLCAEVGEDLGETAAYTNMLQYKSENYDPYISSQSMFPLAVITVVWDVEYEANESCNMEISYLRDMDYLITLTHCYEGFVRVQPEVDTLHGPGKMRLYLEFRHLPPGGAIYGSSAEIHEAVEKNKYRDVRFAEIDKLNYQLELDEKPRGEIIFRPLWYLPKKNRDPFPGSYDYVVLGGKDGYIYSESEIESKRSSEKEPLTLERIIYRTAIILAAEQLVGLIVCAFVLDSDARKSKEAQKTQK